MGALKNLEYLNFSPIPYWLFNMSQSLVHLNRRRSELVGPIPNAFGKLTSLTILDLQENFLTGEILTTFASSLKKLYLSVNQLEGSFAKSIANLSRLVVLDVSSNSLKDIFHENQLLNLSDLRVLDLSSNNIMFNMSSKWLPPFQVDVIPLQSCLLGPKLPRWLQTQKKLSSIDISSAGISDTLPHWFWNLSFNTVLMNLSNNIDNNFIGPIPQISPNLMSLVLANNSFSGPITSICESLVANNSLSFLDLSYNLLSGPLPDCWKYGENLVVLNLAKNDLSGRLPYSIGHLIHLKALRLDMNSFSGSLPSSLKYLTNFFVIDLGGNMLSGKIPPWIGETFVNLMILCLPFNNFSGKFPYFLCQLKHLLYLDLGVNHLSGTIPRCIDNFLTMAKIEAEPSYVDKLSCSIPPWIGYLPSLTYLNLSYNHLPGKIPSGVLSLFPASSFMKNDKLCGHPLRKACSEPFYDDPQCRVNDQQDIEYEDQDHDELTSFYVSMGIGFVTAIFVYWIVLLLNESWR
ncbi:Non-specific serine/threonine protein kinase [Handroanthus impetiginosus]|uniref:Non-specific serine/threonine protein kinase n=1 Tax=Handroanthus impetiginosus TaxID=429701 RepID=A0A2G9I8D2_9LAMI|nr:Non-specific serine/threonine protein kinase [Handroanthus impetiginosus]